MPTDESPLEQDIRRARAHVANRTYVSQAGALRIFKNLLRWGDQLKDQLKAEVAGQVDQVVLYADLRAEVDRLREDQRMLATTIRNTVLAIGDVPDEWEGSVDEGVTLINENVARVNAELEQLRDALAVAHAHNDTA
jgi:hypothetical protein